MLVIPYNIFVGGLTVYYTLNFKKMSKKLFKPKKYTLLEIFKYGTFQSIFFVSSYFFGLCCVTGLWHPVNYIHELALIKGKIIDTTLKFDKMA